MKLTAPSFLKKDKWLHVGIGVIIFFPAWAFFGIVWAICIVIAIAFAKEINDHTGLIPALLTSKEKTGFDMYDWFATVAIPLLVTIIFSIANN